MFVTLKNELKQLSSDDLRSRLLDAEDSARYNKRFADQNLTKMRKAGIDLRKVQLDEEERQLKVSIRDQVVNQKLFDLEVEKLQNEELRRLEEKRIFDATPISLKTKQRESLSSEENKINKILEKMPQDMKDLLVAGGKDLRQFVREII